MGSDCDDAGDFAVLHALADNGEAEILACIYRGSEITYFGPGCMDAINTYYGRPDIPLGASKGNIVGDTREVYAKEIAEDLVTFGHDVIERGQVPDAVEVYRRVLTEAKDTSITIVTVGHLKVLHDLLISKADSLSPLNGRDLIAQKVKKWVCMGGQYPNPNAIPEWNFAKNGAAAYSHTVVKQWPTKCVFSGIEIGKAITTGKKLGETPANNPVRKAYELFLKNLEKVRPSWDLTAVLYAVRGLSTYWDAETSGHNCVYENGTNRWISEPDKEHAYLVRKLILNLWEIF